ncbi:MAG: protein translocase subunit SecD [Syntrophales bacterium]
MFRSIKVRAAMAATICLAGLFYLAPSLTDNLPSFWKEHLTKEKIHLGLDLRGGTHLVLEVDTDKAVESTLERTANNLKETLMENKVRFRSLERKKDKISIELHEGVSAAVLDNILREHYPDLEIASSETASGKETASLRFKVKRTTELKKLAVEQSLETIRNRVDQFGVSEPEIIPEGLDRIIVQLPGIKDTARAKNLIGKTAMLEFKIVDDERSLDEALKGNVPEGDTLIYGYGGSGGEADRRASVPYLVKNKALLTGDSLESAQVKIGDRFGDSYIAIKFNSQGATDFERITSENVKKRLAIVLDGKVHSAPVIQERIAGGQASITGSFTMDEAKDLAIVLRAGALPAPVNILEERTVGPSLGQDSIDKGIWSVFIGAMLVIVFMAIYYNLSGLAADAALLLNIIILLGTLAAFRATLTIPGIAGIVLTIGMAVDANVLIFERIREELRGGKTVRAAVEAGYSRAFATVLDSHVTTLIAALFLFQFGTGPIKGFAVTLSIGIVVSLFTAFYATRIVFDFFVLNKKIKRLSI